jgi:hypothetical protein
LKEIEEENENLEEKVLQLKKDKAALENDILFKDGSND